MADVFLGLGYEAPRLNVHRTGREIDVVASHRTERRVAIAECKATGRPLGGAALNKFVGVLELARSQYQDAEVQGYFISLGGFRQSALEQEREPARPRFVTMDGEATVDQLIQGRILVKRDVAAALAGRCASSVPGVELEPSGEVLAHDLGLMWCLFFRKNRARSHFALVHASGTALDPALADRVIADDAATGGDLHSFEYLAPPSGAIAPTEGSVTAARHAYLDYLGREFGTITLEGLPADADVGTRHISLERLFVPLRLQPVADSDTLSSEPGTQGRNAGTLPPPDRRARADDLDTGQPPLEDVDSASVAQVLSNTSRIAVLGAPGAGKSTLVKRLAIAYAFPERRLLTDDGLPNRTWLPLIVRCRELHGLVRRPIRELLATIAERAEMNEQAAAFESLIGQSLVAGEVLLLIDGLDEIADQQERVAFVARLRVFLATYPSVSVVITSREPGFRVVGSALRSVCVHYRVADLNAPEIRHLTAAWYREVAGASRETEASAERLAGQVLQNDRVVRLARNPLLLTTLLLVRRWLGDLPRRRSVLYGKAIEVLLMTWNVEGHSPIDIEEAIPQLAYVAFALSARGDQRVTLPDLRRLLQEARKELPEVLGFARGAVGDFITRIEDRSSVLSLIGHELLAGSLVSVYEYKHLTFQEYLTAVAVVEGYYPGRRDDDSILTVLRPHLHKPAWREITGLTAVLSGRRATPLVEYFVSQQSVSLLIACLLDEVPAPPEVIASACEVIARAPSIEGARPVVRQLLGGRYGAAFAEAAPWLTTFRDAE